MYKNLYIIIKENCKIVFWQSTYISAAFLLLIPHIYGIANLSSEKSADCFGKMVALIGIPLFVPILKPEQNTDIRDIILIKRFPYRASIFFRIVFAIFLSTAMISLLAFYMLYQGCKFPLSLYAMRTVVISMLLGGAGLLGSALLKNTLAGFLLSGSVVFLFYNHLSVMVFEGIHTSVIIIGILLYSAILLLCNNFLLC